MSHLANLTSGLIHLGSWFRIATRLSMSPVTSIEDSKTPPALEPNVEQKEQKSSHIGKRKAVLIGIRYKGDDILEGTHADVDRFKELLLRTSAGCHYLLIGTRACADTYGYREQDIAVLKDDSTCPPQLLPTKRNIVSEL